MPGKLTVRFKPSANETDRQSDAVRVSVKEDAAVTIK